MELSSAEIIANLRQNSQSSLWDMLEITLIEAEKEKIVATMPIGPNHRQQLGYLHGGISITLAESLASLGSTLNIDLTRQLAFGLEINASHLRPKREGLLTGTAIPIRLGRTVHVWDVRITDEDEKIVCISRCTIAIVRRQAENDSQPKK
ncbi:MAG TPA: PaaI family thioesterase [Ktedonobacteraceae bacterium]